jgi:hypothetical protein
MTLRSGNRIDSYSSPLPFDPALDTVTDEYLEQNHWGLVYLDAESWRYYLPYFISYAVRNRANGASLAVSALVQSLRPPDEEPLRLASVSAAEKQVIQHLLELLGFDDQSEFQGEALQTLEEYWIPGALYNADQGQ